MINKTILACIILLLNFGCDEKSNESHCINENNAEIRVNGNHRNTKTTIEKRLELKYQEFLRKYEVAKLSNAQLILYLKNEGLKFLPEETQSKLLGLNFKEKGVNIFGLYFKEKENHMIGSFSIQSEVFNRRVEVVYSKTLDIVDMELIDINFIGANDTLFQIGEVAYLTGDAIKTSYFEPHPVDPPNPPSSKNIIFERFLKTTKKGFSKVSRK